MQRPLSPAPSARARKIPTNKQLPEASKIIKAIPGGKIEDILSDVPPSELWRIQDLVNNYHLGIGDAMGLEGIAEKDRALIERYLKALEEKN